MRKIQLVLVALIVLILSAFKADHVITNLYDWRFYYVR